MPVSRNEYHLKAAIFDMDGVVTDTAELHFLSWEETFNNYLGEVDIPYVSFSKLDYLRYVDGVMRNDGIKNFLRSRSLLPKDPIAIDELVNRLGKAKDDAFLRIVDDLGVKCFDSTIRLIKFIKELGGKLAVISSSRYCQKILNKGGVEGLFDNVTSGQVLLEKKISGKPDPGIFLEAARSLEELPENCMVVEDALLGVKAGRNGNFGLVIGIDRNDIGANQYREYGADIVVKDLSELSLKDIKQWFGANVDSHL